MWSPTINSCSLRQSLWTNKIQTLINKTGKPITMSSKHTLGTRSHSGKANTTLLWPIDTHLLSRYRQCEEAYRQKLVRHKVYYKMYPTPISQTSNPAQRSLSQRPIKLPSNPTSRDNTDPFQLIYIKRCRRNVLSSYTHYSKCHPRRTFIT